MTILSRHEVGGSGDIRAELEMAELRSKANPQETDNEVYRDNVLAEISQRYHERFPPKQEELDVYQLLQPTVNPITDESPRWQGFDPFFWRT